MKQLLRSNAFRIAAIYLLISCAWQLVTTRLTASLISDPARQMTAMMVNGLILAGLTTCFVYLLMRRDAARQQVHDQNTAITEALHESERKLRALFELLPVGVSILDAQRQVIYANPALEKILDVTADSLRNGLSQTRQYLRADKSAMPPEEFASVRALAEHRVVQQVETGIVKEDGSVTWTVAHAVPVDFPDWNVVIITSDITARKEAEQKLQKSEQLLQLIIEHTPAAIAMFDSEMRYIFASRRYLADYNLGEQQLVGRSHYDIFPEIPQRWKDIHQRCLAGAVEQCAEDPFPRANGTLDWVRWEIRPWHEAQGGIGGIILFSEVITERKLAADQLRHSEEQYRLLAENMADVVWILDTSTLRFTYVSPSVEKLRGYTVDEVLTQTLDQVVSPASLALIEAGLHDRVQAFLNDDHTAVSHADEIEQTRRDGTTVWTEVVTTLLKNKVGGIDVLGVSRDISERRRMVEALRQDEENFSKAFRSSPSALLITRLSDGRYMEVNDAYSMMVGYDRAELIGHSTTEFNIYIQAGDRQAIVDRLVAAGSIRDFETSLRHRSGAIRHVMAAQAIITFSGEVCIMSSMLDISDRKRAEDAMRIAWQRFYTVLSSMYAGILLVTNEDRIEFVNQAFCDLFDQAQPPAALVNLTADELIASIRDVYEHPAAEVARIHEILEQGQPVKDEEISLRGGRTYLRDFIPIAVDGKPYGQLWHHRDITESKRTDAEIRQLNAVLEQRVAERTAELSDLYNNAPCGYHSLDDDGTFVHVNDTELKWLGYEREELIGRLKASDVLTPASVEVFQTNFPVFKANGRLKNLELDMIRKNGLILPVLLSATAVFDAEGRYLMSRSTIIDNTERKRTEAQRQAALEALQESQVRLETANKELEAFAYSISHDLRAPLRAIDGFSRIILEDYAGSLDDEGRRLFDIVRSNTQKMDQLITDLLALSRVSRSQLRVVRFDMTALVHDAYHTIASPDDLEHCTLVVAPLLEACGDPALLRQVWSNLLSNALKYTRPKAERRVEVGGYEQDSLTHVYYVKDNGVGFNPEYHHKLFGIFQRLHSESEFEGTGVGLAVVQRIVQRHGGQVWATAQPDQGAIFYFSLPCLAVNNE